MDAAQIELLEIVELGLVGHQACGVGESAWIDFSDHKDAFGDWPRARELEVGGRKKPEARVVVGVTKHDHELSPERHALLKAGTDELRTNALPLLGRNDSHRAEAKPLQSRARGD